MAKDEDLEVVVAVTPAIGCETKDTPQDEVQKGEQHPRILRIGRQGGEWKSWSTDESQAHSDESANQGTLARMKASEDVRQIFVIARNPEEDSKLPFLLRLPLEGGLVLKARDSWPRSARVYCHPFEGGWPQGAEILEETPIVSCRRRGALIDLVLDRPRLARSQFVFTETRGRATIFWQTQKAARAANPGARVPRARAAVQDLAIAIDTRERYPFRFAGRGVETERVALPAGDYAVRSADALIAAVERKAFENFVSCLSDGTLAFQMQRLSEVPVTAVVIEGRYSALFKLEHVSSAWLADVLARLQVRYPEVQVVFADSRKFAEEWTYRFLAAALADAMGATGAE